MKEKSNRKNVPGQTTLIPEELKASMRNIALFDMKQSNVIKDHGAINEDAIAAIVSRLISAGFAENEVVAIFIEGYFTSPSGVVDDSAHDSQIIVTVREAYKKSIQQ